MTAPLSSRLRPVETSDSAVREGLRPDPAARHHLGLDLSRAGSMLVALRVHSVHRAEEAVRALLVHFGAGEDAHGMPLNIQRHVGLG